MYQTPVIIGNYPQRCTTERHSYMIKKTPGNTVYIKLSDIGLIKTQPSVTGNQLQGAVEPSKSTFSLSNLLHYLSNSAEQPIQVHPAQTLHAPGNAGTAMPYAAYFPKPASKDQCLEIDPKYLYYFLCFKKKQMTNILKPGEQLSASRLSKMLIPLPALKQQKQLADTIEKKIKAVDILTQWINTEISKLKAAASDHLENYFAGFEELLANKNGKTLQLKEAGLVQAGKTPNGAIKNYFGNEYPFFNQTSLDQKMNVTVPVKQLSYKGLLQSRRVSGNSVLVCFNGVHFGEAGLLKEPGAINAQLIAVTPYEFLLPEYLYLQVIAPGFQNQMKQHSVNQFIGKKEFENLLVEVPPVKKQQKIISELLSYLDVHNTKIFEHSNELEKAESSSMELFKHIFENGNTGL